VCVFVSDFTRGRCFTITDSLYCDSTLVVLISDVSTNYFTTDFQYSLSHSLLYCLNSVLGAFSRLHDATTLRLDDCLFVVDAAAAAAALPAALPPRPLCPRRRLKLVTACTSKQASVTVYINFSIQVQRNFTRDGFSS
jgi:hypothetical protein